MKVVLVARDIAPSKAFGLLAQELTNRGHSSVLLVGNGKPMAVTTEDIRTAVRRADVVVVGMSSSPQLAEPEIAACTEAALAEIPFGFYGDTFRCHERAREGAWFAPFQSQAEFFFAINNGEAKLAGNFFPNATVVATGNPLWEEFGKPPQRTREEVRALIGAPADEIVILAPGGKSPAINCGYWSLLADALAEAMEDDDTKYRVILSLHPGDRAPFAIDSVGGKALDIYGDLCSFAPVPFQLAPAGITTAELLPGVNLVYEWGSSIGVEAAHRRIPIISVNTALGRKRHEVASGSPKWELCECHASFEVSDAEDLLERVDDCVEETDAITLLREDQAKAFPLAPEPGAAVAEMLRVLERVVA